MIITIKQEGESGYTAGIDCARYLLQKIDGSIALLCFNEQGVKTHEQTLGDNGKEHIFVVERGKTIDHHIVEHQGKEN